MAGLGIFAKYWEVFPCSFCLIVRDYWALKIIKMRFDKLLFELYPGCIRGLDTEFNPDT